MDNIFAVKSSGLSEQDVEAVVETVDSIAKTHGVCAPHQLVEAARDVESPLHRLFEWDDKIAGEKFRIEQAKRVIKSVRFIVEGRDGAVEMRRYHHVRIEPQPGYVPFERVVSTPNIAQQVVREALKRLALWRAQFAALESVLGPGAFSSMSIDELLKKHSEQESAEQQQAVRE